MLYTMKELLSVARKNHFAVPAFNISSFDMLKSIMEEVEDQNAPVILKSIRMKLPIWETALLPWSGIMPIRAGFQW